ncbi:MAG: pilus assembly protein TadG-related protein [Yoonia sp.]|uniref:TadE/TadG family type IV pilus assembly protein n=1 Tax=Yoonia sp. TaxID=2212373 RepID=UPI003EF935A0
MLGRKSFDERIALFKRSRVAFLKQFGRDEDGSVIIMTMVLLFVMLIIGGMAVDFMRFESRRASLQSVSDRAVLAASDLGQTEDPATVAVDFFNKAGYGDSIVGAPLVEESPGNRSVRINSQVDVGTFYLRFMGIDTLSAPAMSRAREGTANIEISLIVDISGSMDETVSSDDPDVNGKRRIDLLRDAAIAFVNDLLKDGYEDRISISLISYSAHVSAGSELYNAITTTNPLETWTEEDEDGEEEEFFHLNTNTCIEFDAADFETLAFDPDRTYQQVQDITERSGSPLCPDRSFEGIIPVSQDRAALVDALEKIEPRYTTSIHLGMKWGTLLLDPSMRDVIGSLPSVDSAFSGLRPSDYGEKSDTLKYLILMTDGENVSSNRVKDKYYNVYPNRILFSEDTISTLTQSGNWRREEGPLRSVRNDLMTQPFTSAQQDTMMQELCTLAGEKMTVYTIAMGAPDHGREEMLDCATKPAHAYSTNFTGENGEKGIDEIFEAIGQQITALRLDM